ncbi:hypothetical protein BGX29_010912 [Mortierella sp. GBA35]|nr:hypothetical protein BGX29_010912 [Mortierella sp. GBA35]
MTPCTTITTIPSEVLDIMLANLEIHHLATCALVSKEWSSVFTPYIWRSIQCNDTQRLTVTTLFCQDENTPPSRFQRLKTSIESGSLAKNGHWIQTIRCHNYEIAELLATHGQTCTGLQELEIGTTSDVPTSIGGPSYFDLAPLITVLERSTSLYSLILERGMLDEGNPDFVRLIDALPVRLESLEFKQWDPIYSSRRFRFEEEDEGHIMAEDQEQHQPQLQLIANSTKSNSTIDDALWSTPTTVIPNIKRLSFKNYALDHQKATLNRLLQRCPNLETIHLDESYKVMPLKFFSSTLRQYCSKLVNLYMTDTWHYCSDEELVDILDASTAGWRSLGLPQNCHDPHEFGTLSTAALLRHSATLVNLRLDGSSLLPSSTVQQLLSSAPNLRRLDAVRKDRSLQADFELDASDIVSGDPWVCTELESLKVRIVGVPRPDLTKRSNGRPLEGPLHQGTMEASRKVQDGVYGQLGRLTKLKQLVLGHDDVDDTRSCRHYEALSEGEYYQEGAAIQQGHQYECLEMTLESGMHAMRGLKGLRTLELGAMEVGAIDQEWARRNWPRLGSRYKDTFWTDLGYKDYY